MRTPLRSAYAPIAAIAIAGLMADTAAAESIGCASASGGALNAELAASTSATRSVTLAVGDVLDISVRKGATVVLVSGPGAPLTLSSSTTSGLVSFKAPE